MDTPAGRDMIGEILGSYRVVARIGQGGMGTVYAGEHPRMGRKVAIKVLLPEYSTSADSLERFFNEARATANLRRDDHPWFVDIIDCGMHERTGSAFIIMDLLEGETLERRLARAGGLTTAEAVRIGREIALGMEVAHGAGIVHRDLKPDNVFLVRPPASAGPEAVRILDFGIAKIAGPVSGRHTRTGALLGTPVYMSPEQCRGASDVDARADVYALGGILFAMVCGRPPFVYEAAGELIGAHLHQQPPAPGSLVALPGPLEALIVRSLAKTQGDRPQSMAEVAAALQALAAPGFTPAPGATAVYDADAPAAPRVKIGETRVLPVADERRGQTTMGSAAFESVARPPLRRGRWWPLAGLIGAAAIAVTGFALFGRQGREAPAPAAAPTAERAPARETAPAREATLPIPRAPEVAPAPEIAPPQPSLAAEATLPARPSAALRAQARPRDAIVVTVPNRREGSKLRVTVDGLPSSLPVRLPRDRKIHVLRFEIPNFKPEVHPVTADRDQVVRLRYQPAALTDFN